MGNLIRLLVRFILVPLGFAAAALAETVVVFVVSWRAFGATLERGDGGFDLLAAFLEDQLFVLVGLVSMLTPILVGILIAEALAIRSWIFHVLNSVVSSWVGWHLFGGPGNQLIEPMTVIAAGIAGGFAYWAIAGCTAGFYKPVLRRDPPPALPATGG